MEPNLQLTTESVVLYKNQLEMQEAEIISFSSIDDNEVIERILAGEKSIFELIMRRYNRCLFRVGLSILKNEADVEDAMQETYIKAYQHLINFRKQSSLGTWLIRILINEALLNRKYKNHLSAINISTLQDLCKFKINENETPEGYLINRELKSVLEQAILELPENYGQVYIMREVEQIDVKATSECLGISEVNVRVRLNRAKVMLKKFIKKEIEIFPFHLSRCNRIVQNVLERI